MAARQGREVVVVEHCSQSDMCDISFVIPVLNDAQQLRELLQILKPQSLTSEVIVVDGSSTDDSYAVGKQMADVCIKTEAGRATQMNAGAMVAKGSMLVFVHADTRLYGDALQHLEKVVTKVDSEQSVWGYFAVKLSGRHWLLRCVEWMMNRRSRLSHIGTGDQTLFVAAKLFNKVNGFPRVALMEDISICAQLKQHSSPIFLHTPVVTSSRRWESQGVWRTIFKMWRLRLAYWLGVDAARLAAIYYARD